MLTTFTLCAVLYNNKYNTTTTGFGVNVWRTVTTALQQPYINWYVKSKSKGIHLVDGIWSGLNRSLSEQDVSHVCADSYSLVPHAGLHLPSDQVVELPVAVLLVCSPVPLVSVTTCCNIYSNYIVLGQQSAIWVIGTTGGDIYSKPI